MYFNMTLVSQMALYCKLSLCLLFGSILFLLNAAAFSQTKKDFNTSEILSVQASQEALVTSFFFLGMEISDVLVSPTDEELKAMGTSRVEMGERNLVYSKVSDIFGFFKCGKYRYGSTPTSKTSKVHYRTFIELIKKMKSTPTESTDIFYENKTQRTVSLSSVGTQVTSDDWSSVESKDN